MLSIKKLPIVVIGCKVFQDLLEKHLPTDRIQRVHFLDYGLHRTPRILKTALQREIDSIEEPSLIMISYGLCGNGLNGIQAGKHYLLVPRADDCIAILLGSYEAYQREFNASPGTYYLSKGWLESGSNPLQEYQEYVEKYDEQQATFLLDVQYRNYTRLVFVAHHTEDLEKYRSKALEVAQFCSRWGMQYEEILGSDRYIQQLIEVALDLYRLNDEFVLVPPGGELSLSQFIRDTHSADTKVSS